MISFALPGMRLVNPTNEHTHWRIRHKRSQEQRHKARVVAQAAGVHLEPLPLVITITRVGPGKLDSDSLPPSGKHVRDGIADAIGVDDGDDTKVTWLYAQERAKTWGVRVEIRRHDEVAA